VSEAITQACTDGARHQPACDALGLSARTLQRWRRDGAVTGDRRLREHRPQGSVRTPANRLSVQEQEDVLAVANEVRFAHLSPHQIVPALADEGRYLASESTFYRLLRGADQLARRGRPKAPARVRPQPLEATGPNQVWSWDITYLASTVRGTFFYLYLIMDVYSRKIVGWEVYPQECAAHAASVFHKAHLREGVRADALVLHSDNGAPMKGATMLATLQSLRPLVQRRASAQRPEVRHTSSAPSQRGCRPADQTRRPLQRRQGCQSRPLVRLDARLEGARFGVAQPRKTNLPDGPIGHKRSMTDATTTLTLTGCGLVHISTGWRCH
jgi:transposase InsO family protein